MKLNKQILEAINRGINLALDNFDNEVPIQQGISKVKTRDSINSILEELYQKVKNLTLTENDYNDIIEYSKFPNTIKYKVNDIRELRPIIEHILCHINIDANLNWIDTSSIHSMSFLFMDTDFNGDISEWDVSNVTTMSKMFYQCSFNGDLSKWNVSNVKNMSLMFANTPNFDNNSICNWDVSHVEDMHGMFMYATFDLDLSNWNVSNVIDMSKMFYGSSFTSNISNWDVSSIIKMDEMFTSDYVFLQDLSKWNLEMLFKKPKDIFKFTDMQWRYNYWPEKIKELYRAKK